MKKYLLSMMLSLSVLLSFSQKINRETLQYGSTHIPENLIYDQIKSYGVSVNVIPSAGFNLDYNFATSSAGGFMAYSKVPYENADMQVQVTYGPYTAIEEKTVSKTATEEVNKVKVSVTYFKRQLSFRFPVTYTVTNRKNGVKLFYNEYSNGNIRSIESPDFRTEQEAVNSFNQSRNGGLLNDINTLVQSFCNGCNATAKDKFDFYPSVYYANIFQFKKWDRDDEYNGHVKNVIKTFEVMTADENAAAYTEKIKADLDYFKQFDGLFKPDDKKEDILYFGNYYNLSVIYLALDDYEKASWYLQKLDSSDKEKSFTTGLRNSLERTKRRTARHFLTNAHLNYNPVSDYRLSDKTFSSDAMSSTELMTQSVSGGSVAAADEVISSEGKTLIGKIFFDNETGQLKMIPADKAETPILITPLNSRSLKMGPVNYTVAKANLDGGIQKSFYKVEYESGKIKLLQLLKTDLTVVPDYLGVLRPNEDMVTVLLGWTVKKNLGKYFSDCPTVSEKAKDGEFGGSAIASKDRLTPFIEMCKQYSDCK